MNSAWEYFGSSREIRKSTIRAVAGVFLEHEGVLGVCWIAFHCCTYGRSQTESRAWSGGRNRTRVEYSAQRSRLHGAPPGRGPLPIRYPMSVYQVGVPNALCYNSSLSPPGNNGRCSPERLEGDKLRKPVACISEMLHFRDRGMGTEMSGAHVIFLVNFALNWSLS